MPALTSPERPSCNEQAGRYPEGHVCGGHVAVSKFFSLALCSSLAACGCGKYASEYSCGYLVDEADYEVWYWKDVEADNEADNKFIGHATGIRQCEDNARAFAAAIDDPFSDRAYICVLMDDGKRMEKHRNLETD